MVIVVLLRMLVDVSCETPGICENWYSSGWATDEAMVSGLAPGRLAETWMVGKSICGNGATGSIGKATMPINRIPAINSEVAIGRLMNGSEIFTARTVLNSEAPPAPSLRALGSQPAERAHSHGTPGRMPPRNEARLPPVRSDSP